MDWKVFWDEERGRSLSDRELDPDQLWSFQTRPKLPSFGNHACHEKKRPVDHSFFFEFIY